MQLPPFLTRTEHGDIDLSGHRIGLSHVVYHFNEGWSAEMILCRFPSLRLSHIYKVIAFYLENKAEVDAYIRDYDEEMEHVRDEAPKTDWDAMRSRLASKLNADMPPVGT